MEIKKSEFRHEIEHEGYPPVSNFEDYRALEDFLKSMDPDEAPIKELECSPPVTPSSIFGLAGLGAFLKKVAGDVWYYSETNPQALSLTPEDLGLTSTNPEDLPDNVETASGPYRKMTRDLYDQMMKAYPGGTGATQQIEQVRGDLIERFEPADKAYEYISKDKRYSVDGAFGPDQNLADWTTFYTETRDYLYSEDVIRSESDISDLRARIGRVVRDAQTARETVEKNSVDIPRDSNIYYVDKKFLTTAPSGLKGYVISKETVEHEGASVPSVQLMTPDGDRIVILQEELERASQSPDPGGKYYIPAGTLIHDGADTRSKKSIPAPYDMRGAKVREYSAKPDQFGLPDEEGRAQTKIWDFQDLDGITWQVRRIDLRNVTELRSSLRLGGIETTEDRPPYAWRDEPETQEINITHSPVEGDKPFNGPPMSGNVPFLSMPNVGDVMTDRTNTQGHAGDAEYLGKNQKKLDEEKAKNEMMARMKTRYESSLNSAITEGQPSPIVKYYEEMIGRYRDIGT